MKDNSTTWGGARINSGRKIKDRVNLTFRADPDIVDILKSKKNKSDYLNDLIRKDNGSLKK